MKLFREEIIALIFIVLAFFVGMLVEKSIAFDHRLELKQCEQRILEAYDISECASQLKSCREDFNSLTDDRNFTHDLLERCEERREFLLGQIDSCGSAYAREIEELRSCKAQNEIDIDAIGECTANNEILHSIIYDLDECCVNCCTTP